MRDKYMEHILSVQRTQMSVITKCIWDRAQVIAVRGVPSEVAWSYRFGCCSRYTVRSPSG